MEAIAGPQTTVCPILDNTGEIVEYIAARADVTELVENRQEMQALLTTDNLTGLPNRYQMLIDLSHQTLMTVILLIFMPLQISTIISA